MRSVFLFSEGLDPLGFRMKSKAPSIIASVVTWAPAAVSRLIITTLVRMRRRLSSLRTSMPLMSGMTMSRVTRSGWSSLNNRTASFPLAASATTVQPARVATSRMRMRMRMRILMIRASSTIIRRFILRITFMRALMDAFRRSPACPDGVS